MCLCVHVYVQMKSIYVCIICLCVQYFFHSIIKSYDISENLFLGFSFFHKGLRNEKKHFCWIAAIL